MKLTDKQCKKIKEVLKNAYGDVVGGTDGRGETRYYMKDEVVERIKEIVEKENETEVCVHDWQTEAYEGIGTTNFNLKKWRCKKCLEVCWTKE